MTKSLTESEIISLLLHEYDAALSKFITEVDASPYKGQSMGHTLAVPMLKVKHKKTGIAYTVDSVDLDMVTLRTPEGDPFHVSQQEFEKDYELS